MVFICLIFMKKEVAKSKDGLHISIIWTFQGNVYLFLLKQWPLWLCLSWYKLSPKESWTTKETTRIPLSSAPLKKIPTGEVDKFQAKKSLLRFNFFDQNFVTAKRKLERHQFSTSSLFVKIWSACSCEFKAYLLTFWAL